MVDEADYDGEECIDRGQTGKPGNFTTTRGPGTREASPLTLGRAPGPLPRVLGGTGPASVRDRARKC